MAHQLHLRPLGVLEPPIHLHHLLLPHLLGHLLSSHKSGHMHASTATFRSHSDPTRTNMSELYISVNGPLYALIARKRLARKEICKFSLPLQYPYTFAAPLNFFN